MDDINISLEQQLENAFALQQKNQLTEAIAIFTSILATNPLQVDALHGIGMALAQRGDFPQAINYMKQAVQHAPHIAEFHNNLGNAYKGVGKINEAMQHYQEALRLKSNYPQAHNNMGSLLYRLAKYDEALVHFQKAIRMDPKSVDTHYNLANCFIQLDRLLDAAAHYEETLKIRPDHIGAMHNLGITYSALKRFEQAQPLLEQVLQREPNNVDALFHMGVISGAMFKTNEAKSYYERLLSIHPDHASAHHNLATIYLQLEDKDKAKAHYQKAFSLEPLNKTAEHMIHALSGKTHLEGAPLEYTKALFDQYAYNYDQHIKNQLKYRVPTLLREAISPFTLSITTPWHGLDLGCGTGLCAPLFADVVATLVGVDISSNMIEVARTKGGYHQLYVMDILSFLTMDTNKFDIIIAADVFVYFGSLDEVFKACKKSLKPNGFFCFSIENLTPKEVETQPEFHEYQLRQTGRYAHSPDYIQKLSKLNHFNIKVERNEIIRYQEDTPVEGSIYVLQNIL